MSAPLVAVDIGNTHTTVGLFRASELVDSWRLATKVPRAGDEIWLLLSEFLTSSGVAISSLSQIAISSVVPESTAIYVRMIRKRLGLEPLLITCENVKTLRIAYKPPQAVGADRLCGCVAAFSKYGGPLAIVDLGTATVFDVVSHDAVYLGGVISPGIATAALSLHQSAAMLPSVELSFPDSVIGDRTDSAIQSGILFGALDMIDGIIGRIERQMESKVKVVATGGFAELLQPRSKTIQFLEPNLVLNGIQIITGQQ